MSSRKNNKKGAKAPVVESRCHGCDQLAKCLRCGRCRVATYCSVECVSHWLALEAGGLALELSFEPHTLKHIAPLGIIAATEALEQAQEGVRTHES